MNELVIERDNLKKAFDAIFSKIAGSLDSSISISNDYYLNIPMDEAYNVSNSVMPSIGSLYDDWENLMRVINEQQPVTFVDVDRLASIMKAISQELNPPI
jgi:hypothetical protein